MVGQFADLRYAVQDEHSHYPGLRHRQQQQSGKNPRCFTGFGPPITSYWQGDAGVAYVSDSCIINITTSNITNSTALSNGGVVYGGTSSTVNIVESDIAKSSSQVDAIIPDCKELSCLSAGIWRSRVRALRKQHHHCANQFHPHPCGAITCLVICGVSLIAVIACQGGSGGAVAAVNAIAMIQLSKFIGTTAQVEGGALSFTSKTSLSLHRSVFEASTAVTDTRLLERMLLLLTLFMAGQGRSTECE